MIRRTTRYLGWVVALVATILCSFARSASAAEPPFIEANADWLTTVNYYRAMAGLSSVADNPAWSSAAEKHSCYMLFNGITHYEVPGNPGYTPEGEEAGKNSNVAVSSVVNETARKHIELWMTGPFHAIGVLRPNLTTVGFGKCDNAATSPYRSAATLDVLHGLAPAAPQAQPILFPGNGTATSLSRFVVESPNPLTFCGWSGEAGLPVIALMPEGFSTNPTATFSGTNGPIEVCVLSAKNTTGTAQQILAGNNAVIVIPRQILAPDTYAVSISTSARSVSWSFTVDPDAAHGVQPVPQTTPLNEGTGLHPVDPVRLVDTRINLGATRLIGTLPKRIQIAGRGGVPADAEAISANFTITAPAASGFLTVWNCSAERPVVSTLNYGTWETVPNGASVPLDLTGGICVYSQSSADLVVDVNGYYAKDVAGRFVPIAPVRLLDSRIGLAAPGRLGAGSTVALPVAGVAGVPVGASLVALNVTSVSPAESGYVTVYPCDRDRPTVSSLNPAPNAVKPNLVISPVAEDGTVCLFTFKEVDLVVDITGYVADSGALSFTASTPFRLTDTRDRNRPDMNAGTNGQPVAQGQILTVEVAGVRGVAAEAKAVSANFTVIGGVAAGFVTAWPCGQPPPTSTVNFEPVAAIANGAQMPLSESGDLCVLVSNSVHVIIDINGWWS